MSFTKIPNKLYLVEYDMKSGRKKRYRSVYLTRRGRDSRVKGLQNAVDQGYIDIVRIADSDVITWGDSSV